MMKKKIFNKLEKFGNCLSAYLKNKIFGIAFEKRKNILITNPDY